METPGVVVERERERVHKILFGVTVFIGVLLYAAFNLWVYKYSSGNAPSPKALWQTVQTVTGLNPVKKQGSTLPESGLTIGTPQPPTPTPTPRPTGPGEYACDPYGVCNKYSDEARKEFCTVTFADSQCFDQCGDKTKQCKK